MAKHLFYVTNTQLTATQWDKGTLSAGRTFDNFPSGWTQFAEYVRDMPAAQAFLLTDLIEEDFQRENVPHVIGSAGRNLIERRLLNLYRDTPYRRATRQGREKTGRKDDQMLFSALTNPLLINPWLEVLLKQSVDVAGIYSVALLKSLLTGPLGLVDESTLLVTHQSSGWRQSFFQQGHLRFSRLAPETAWSPESIAEIATAEIGKTRQFLASTRLIARDAAIRIVVLASTEIISHLRPLSIDGAGAQYRFVDLAEAQRAMKVARLGELTHCDGLFLSLLGTKRVPSHYSTPEQTRFHQLVQLRTLGNALSVAVIAGGVVWSIANGLSAVQASRQTRDAQLATQEALANYQSTANSMPVTVANPHDMKAAVGMAVMIAQNRPSLNPLLTALSTALEGLPQVKVREINWQTSEATSGALADPAAAAMAPDAAPASADNVVLTAGLIGVPAKPVQTVTLEGEIAPFTNDYRFATESVQQLIIALQKDSRLQAELIKPPLDVRPSVKLEAKAGSDAELARPVFTLKLVWKP